MLWFWVGIAGIGGLLSAGTAFADQKDDAERGKVLVKLNCAGCHAVYRTGESSHPRAPPFRTLSQRYPIDALEEAFAEGIVTGHPDMPEFTASPEQINEILAFINSLNE